MGGWFSGPEAQPQRSIGQETRESLQAQVDLAPQLFEAESKYGPQYADLNRKLFSDSLFGTDGNKGILDIQAEAQPRLDALSQAGASSQRGQDVADVARYGPAATAALRAANPQQAALMDEINRQALDELKLGATLDPSLRREVTQSLRGAQSARGWGYSPRDAANEVLLTASQAEQLRRQRQAYASSVVGLNAGTTQDPFMSILGRPSQSAGQAQAMMGQFNYGNSGPRLFQPMNPYAQDVYNTNYNAEAARRITSANNRAALTGSIIEAGGAVLGAAVGAAGMCWVAREVFGEADPRWVRFRAWMMHDAPGWFRNLYLARGEAFAGWLKRDGWLQARVKGVLKKWMLKKIGE